jgi:hypothetical protein
MTRDFEDPKSPRGARRYPAVRCARCNGERWPYGGITPRAPFVCQRCRLVLSGARCVVDPATPERRAAWKASGIALPPGDRNPSEEAVHVRTRRAIAGRSTDPSPDPHKQRGSGGRFLSPELARELSTCRQSTEEAQQRPSGPSRSAARVPCAPQDGRDRSQRRCICRDRRASHATGGRRVA